MITSRLGRQGQIRECTIGFVGFCCYLNFGKSERCRTPISKVETFFSFFEKTWWRKTKIKITCYAGQQMLVRALIYQNIPPIWHIPAKVVIVFSRIHFTLSRFKFTYQNS